MTDNRSSAGTGQPLKTSNVLVFEEGTLTVKLTGHGRQDGWATLSFKEDQFELDADGYQVVEIAPSELRELRDFLTRVLGAAQAPTEAGVDDLEEIIADLRREKLRLHDALRNMMGAYDTPLSRRRFPPDEFMQAALQSGRDALSAQPPAAPVETEERDRCISICEGWLERFAGMDIQYTSAREYACDAVNDIIDLIRDGADPRSQAKEPEANEARLQCGLGSEGSSRHVAGRTATTTSENLDVTAGETAPHFRLSAATGDEPDSRLPLQYEDGPDYCTVKDAQGRDFALTIQPELMQAMERALREDISRLSRPPVTPIEPQTAPVWTPVADAGPDVKAACDRVMKADEALGKWMSAALDDDKVCIEMKVDILEWFEAHKAPTSLAFTRPQHSRGEE